MWWGSLDHHRAKSPIPVCDPEMPVSVEILRTLVCGLRRSAFCISPYQSLRCCSPSAFGRGKEPVSNLCVHYKNVSTLRSVIWKVLPVFRYSRPTISNANSLYRMRIIIFLMCEYERHFTNTFAHWKGTPPVTTIKTSINTLKWRYRRVTLH